MCSVASKVLISPANRTLNSRTSKRLRGPTPLLPAQRRSQNPGASHPRADTTPTPVTTTRLVIGPVDSLINLDESYLSPRRGGGELHPAAPTRPEPSAASVLRTSDRCNRPRRRPSESFR